MEIDINKVLEKYDKQFIEINKRNILLTLENEELINQIKGYDEALHRLAKELEELKEVKDE
jgi:hypothetical protein